MSDRFASGNSLVEDFRIAKAFSPTLISTLQDAILMGEDGDSRVISMGDLNEQLAESTALTSDQFVVLAVGLQKLGVATERSSGRTYAEYTFDIDVGEAIAVLDQQRIASAALSQTKRSSQRTEITWVGTFPESVSLRGVVGEILTLGSEIRELVLEANTHVRLASPYFSPGEEVVSDLSSLPRKGVDLEILTRELSSPSDDTRATLNSIHEAAVIAENPEKLTVRDLYAADDYGRQLYATHAKMLVVDDEFCYVGSGNLTHHSLGDNFEFGVIVRGPEVADAAAVFDAVFSIARKVELPV